MRLLSSPLGWQGSPPATPASQPRSHKQRHFRYRATKCDPNTLWHAQYHVNTFPTELWGLQAMQPPQAQLLVVPGNPGLAGFYRTFMHQLYNAFGGSVDVMAVSHVGHDAHNISQGAVWGLDSQVQHKVQLLQELVLGPDRPPAVILAHSIGSYIMLQALQQLEQEQQRASRRSSTAAGPPKQILKVFLLMPFLSCDWSSWEQRLLAAAARHHAKALAAAADTIRLSPGWLQDILVELMAPGAEPHAAACLRTAFNKPGFRNNWHMAAQEFRQLDVPVDWGLIGRLGSKAAVVYNPTDPWFQQYDDMRAALPGIEEHVRPGLGHAFCLSTRECEVMAQLVQQSVEAALTADRGATQHNEATTTAAAARGARQKLLIPGTATAAAVAAAG